MKDSYKVIDMDTHVNPSRSWKSMSTQLSDLGLRSCNRITVCGNGHGPMGPCRPRRPLPWRLFLTIGFQEKCRVRHTRAVPGARTALEGRVITHHRIAVQQGADEENADGRIADMDLEGRDIDFIFPGTWAGLTALDVTLAEGLYRAYHRYMHAYTAKYPDRLKSAVQVPGADVAWAVQEVKALAQEKWVAAVWIHLPEGKPIDHPDFEPLWATMNDLDLPSSITVSLWSRHISPGIAISGGTPPSPGRHILGGGPLLRLCNCLGAL